MLDPQSQTEQTQREALGETEQTFVALGKKALNM